MQTATCDNCGKTVGRPTDFQLPITLGCGYGSEFDGESLDFCKDKCLREWVLKNIDENGNRIQTEVINNENSNSGK